MDSWNAAGPIVQWLAAVAAVGLAIFGAMQKVFSNDKIWEKRKEEWDRTMAELKEAHAAQIKEYKDAYKQACADMATKMSFLNEEHRAEVREIKEGHKEADVETAKKMDDLIASNELVAEVHLQRAIGETKAIANLENAHGEIKRLQAEIKRLMRRIGELEDFDGPDSASGG